MLIEEYLNNPNNAGFYITTTTPKEVLNLIKHLDPNKASDVYNISPKFVVDSKLFLSNAICKLFNKSIEDYSFPDVLKFEKVLPSHKSMSKMDCKNYRPISLLPIFSKIIWRE